MINSRFLDGMTIEQAKAEVAKRLEKETRGNRPVAQRQVNYRLRDWGISRQRYWGCPIPIIHCDKCGVVPVPEKDLPVTLPEDVTFDKPGNPLDRHPTWKNVTCPAVRGPGAARDRHHGHLRRLVLVLRPLHRSVDHDRADDRKWRQRLDAGRPIYRRHRARDSASALFALLHPRHAQDRPHRHGRAVRRPVHAGHGGARDLPRQERRLGRAGQASRSKAWARRARATLASTGEPIEIGSIEKMSKSKKNTVDPDDIIAAYGADTARWFMLSDSPPERDVIWTEEGVQGAWRFVQRLWRMVGEIADVKAPRRAPGEFRRAGA